MDVPAQNKAKSSTSIDHTTRPGRGLIGWMDNEAACLMLASRRSSLACSEEFRLKAERARIEVDKRPTFQGRDDIVMDADDSLSEYIATFMAQPDFKRIATQGWEVKIVDLRKVCALQPMVFCDYSQEQTQNVIPGDMLTIAHITLPIRTKAEELPIQFDESKNTWVATSLNSNLKIVGSFSGPIETEEGGTIFNCGFGIAVTTSFAQVARYRGRYILRDGYHRTIGLLARGITHAPVIFRDFGEHESLGMPRGMLNASTYLGDRPPYLGDYLSDDVAADIQAPAFRHIVMIHGQKVSLLD